MFDDRVDQSLSEEQLQRLRDEWLFTMMVASLCSNTHVELSDGGVLAGTGNPTELAMQVLSHQAQLSRNAFAVDWEFRGECPFDSTIKRMSTGWRHRDEPVAVVLCKVSLAYAVGFLTLMCFTIWSRPLRCAGCPGGGHQCLCQHASWIPSLASDFRICVAFGKSRFACAGVGVSTGGQLL